MRGKSAGTDRRTVAVGGLHVWRCRTHTNMHLIRIKQSRRSKTACLRPRCWRPSYAVQPRPNSWAPPLTNHFIQLWDQSARLSGLRTAAAPPLSDRSVCGRSSMSDRLQFSPVWASIRNPIWAVVDRVDPDRAQTARCQYRDQTINVRPESTASRQLVYYIRQCCYQSPQPCATIHALSLCPNHERKP